VRVLLLALLVALAAPASAQPPLPTTPEIRAQYEKIPVGEIGNVSVFKDECNTCEWRVKRVSENEILLIGFSHCEKKSCTPSPPVKFK
jgi:hypothetical protein